MNVRRENHEENLDAVPNRLEKACNATCHEPNNRLAPLGLNAYMNGTTGRAADSRVRSLAEAVILQSIEDLWNPISRSRSLKFFAGNGFKLYAKMAGIRYIKQLAILKMLADSGKRGH